MREIPVCILLHDVRTMFGFVDPKKIKLLSDVVCVGCHLVSYAVYMNAVYVCSSSYPAR